MDSGYSSEGAMDGAYHPAAQSVSPTPAEAKQKKKRGGKPKPKTPQKKDFAPLETVQYRSFDRTLTIYHYDKAVLPFDRFVSDFVKPDVDYVETRTAHDPLALFRSDESAPLETKIPEGDEVPEDVYEVVYLERPFASKGARQGSAIAFRDGKENKVTWFCFGRRVQRDIETMKIDEESGESFLSEPAQEHFSAFEAKKPFEMGVKDEIDQVEGGRWLFDQVATLDKGAKQGVKGHFEHRVWFESVCQAKKEVEAAARPKLKMLLKGHNWDGKKDGKEEHPLIHFSTDDDDVVRPNLIKKRWAYDLSAGAVYSLEE
ncbi:hypothetical protein BDV96DRAFT_607101 [Lophiotrema nucula]|uniref:Uncharacterized protein n=1 Tax=Lophiotrema nucula TaxID=690887 RepID=A0A6A5YHW4_9PLEO|nr:hypothetical protein BDV96DRAFT_607101 [Lophiotrema nucula]